MSRMTVNGRPVEFLMEPDTPLLWALRDAANLTGTKYGCGVGDCGACMVHIDGEALRSCLVTIAEAEGREVITIEGLSRDRSHPVQQAMVAEQAIQCGFCTPGIVMAAAALAGRKLRAEQSRYRGSDTQSVPLRRLPQADPGDRAGRAGRAPAGTHPRCPASGCDSGGGGARSAGAQPAGARRKLTRLAKATVSPLLYPLKH